MPPTTSTATEHSAISVRSETISPAAPATSSVSTEVVRDSNNQDIAMLVAMIQNIHEEQQRAREEQQQAREEQQRGQEQLLEAVSNLKGDVASIRKDVDMVEERVTSLETGIEDMKHGLAGVQKEVIQLKTRGVTSSGSVVVQGPRVKVPPYDGTTSWAAYRHQFRTVAAANGWSDDQCLTALTVALRGQALSVIEALPNENSGFKELIDALESRYGERHLEHVFRAQLRDRIQRTGEGLQQWALEIEKLVRKAYPTSDPKTIETYLVQAFVDGIRDMEVRTAVRLRHHTCLKEALAHGLEVDACRQDARTSHKLRGIEEVEEVKFIKPSPKNNFGPMCYGCGKRGHIRPNCPKKVEVKREVKEAEAPTSQEQGNE